MIQHPSVNIFVGKPKVGKSNLIKYLIYEYMLKFPIDLVFVFTKTSYNHGYDFIDNRRIYKFFDLDSLSKIIKFIENYQNNGNKINTILIFDDCIDKKNKNELFIDILFNHRHLNLSVFYSTQYLAGKLGPDIRESVTNVFLFKVIQESSIKKNHECFLGFIDNKTYETLNFSLPQYSFIYVNVEESKYEICKVESVVPEFHIVYKNKI